MNSRSVVGYGALQKLHPLSLLAQLISRQVSGHFKLYSGTGSWSLFLDQGKLNFATSSNAPFDRLEHHLKRLEAEAPSLVGAVRVQMRLLFERSTQSVPLTSDYEAICWLVRQSHLTTEQAGELIRAMAVDVIEPFLEVREGSYDLLGTEDAQPHPVILCRLDLRPIVEVCQRNRRSARQSTVPAVSPEAPAAAKTPVAAPAKADYTVACIDDSPTVLNAIQDFLHDKSLKVVPINDPVKALMQVMRCRPDLILLDVTMPNLDGYELCSLLRRHPSFKNTPIVMVTGNTGLIDRAKAKLVRASGYLTKPFSQSELLKMVFMHLPAKGTHQQKLPK